MKCNKETSFFSTIYKIESKSGEQKQCAQIF